MFIFNLELFLVRSLLGSTQKLWITKEVSQCHRWRTSRTKTQIHRCRKGFKRGGQLPGVLWDTFWLWSGAGRRKNNGFFFFSFQCFMLWWDCTGNLDTCEKNLYRQGCGSVGTGKMLKLANGFVRSKGVIESLLLASQTNSGVPLSP